MALSCFLSPPWEHREHCPSFFRPHGIEAPPLTPLQIIGDFPHDKTHLEALPLSFKRPLFPVARKISHTLRNGQTSVVSPPISEKNSFKVLLHSICNWPYLVSVEKTPRRLPGRPEFPPSVVFLFSWSEPPSQPRVTPVFPLYPSLRVYSFLSPAPAESRDFFSP